MTTTKQAVPVWHRVMRGAIVTATLPLASVMAYAGQCPADKRVADGQGQRPGATEPRGVTDTVRASTDLSKEPAAVAGRLLRLRQLDVQPGGIVPWHSHNNRPAIIYIVSGEIVEYASNCAVPIVHRAGDVTAERNGTSHWWKNEGGSPAVLLSSDLFPVEMKMDPHTM